MVRTQQIIVGALVAGALGFLVVAAVLVSQGTCNSDGDGEGLAEMAWVMNLVLGLFLIGDVAARLIVPNILVANARRLIVAGKWSVPLGPTQADVKLMIERTGDAGKLFVAHQIKLIVGAAIIEGVTFFAIIVYMVTESMFGLGVAIVMLAVLALHFPTREGVLNWIEDQLRRIDEERSLGVK